MLRTLQNRIRARNTGKHPVCPRCDWPQSLTAVLRGFPLFKRCEWLIVNCNVGKRALLATPSARGKKEYSQFNFTQTQYFFNRNIQFKSLHISKIHFRRFPKTITCRQTTIFIYRSPWSVDSSLTDVQDLKGAKYINIYTYI